MIRDEAEEIQHSKLVSQDRRLTRRPLSQKKDTITDEEAIEQAALIIRQWEHDGHWSALPEARAILSLFRRLTSVRKN